MSRGDAARLAERVVQAFDRRELMGLLSDRDPGLDLDDAYEVASVVREIRAGRGERPIGRKIGFTNRNLWPQYGVWAPIWGPVYDSTTSWVEAGVAELAIGGLVQP